MFGSKSSGDKWPIKYLSEIVDPNCPISYGIVQPGDELEDGVPIVRPVDLNSNYYVYKNGLKRTTEAISNSYKRTILRGDELLLCVRGTTGVMGLATEELKGGNVTRGITPLYFKEGFNRIYLLGAFLSDDVQAYIKDNTVGSTLKGINMERVRKIQIPIPPIEIQNKWEEVFKQADKSKFMRSKSQFIEMFRQSTLGNGIIGDYLLLKAGKAMPADRISSSKADGMFPCFGGNGIRGYVDSYNYDGDYAIIGRQGALCGNVCLAQGKFYATEHAVVVTPKVIVDTTWLFYALNQMNLNQYARGVAQPGLAVNELEKLPFSVPDSNKQIEFSNIAKQADKSKLIGLLWKHCHCRDVYTK